MDRRDFLKAIALTGVAMIIKPGGTMDLLAQSVTDPASGGKTVLIAVMGGEPDALFRKAIAEMGGMKKFVIAGAKNSGIEDAAKTAGAKVVPAHEESYYRDISLPHGKILKNAKVHRAILDSDVWINVPVLKHHGGANLTISMKNLMGIVWDRGAFHRDDLQQCIADICTLQKKPALNVVDAYRVMKTNGPRGQSADDVVLAKGLFVSPDIVAVDTAATKFFNQIREMPMESVGHLANGQALNIGTTDLDKLNVKRIKL